MAEPRLDQDDERLLGEVLAGERSTDDAEVRALFARIPHTRALCSDLGELTATLAAAGDNRRRDLSSLRTPPTAAELAEVQRALAKHRATEQRGIRRGWWLAAAALVAVAVALRWLLPPSPTTIDPRTDPRLGGPPITGSPVGATSRYGTFVADCVLTSGQLGQFLVYADVDGKEREIARSRPAPVTEWQPGPADAARIEACPAIRWEFVVSATDADERIVARGRAVRSR